MNKLFSKVAALSVGLAMAIGVGVAVSSKEAKVARAESEIEFTLSSAADVEQEGVSVSFATGSGTSDPTWYDAGLRLYASNTITISSSDSITGVSFNWEKQGKKTFNTVTADVGSYTHPSSAGVGSWTGSANTIVFTLGDTGQLQLNTFSVTYSGSTPTDPLTSITVSGSMSKTSYTTAEAWSPAGLVATGHYESGADKDVTNEVTWSFNPSNPAVSVTSVVATASIGTVSGSSSAQTVTVSKANQIQAIYAQASGASIDVYGYYVGYLTHTNKDGTITYYDVIIQDGEYGIMAYGLTTQPTYTINETVLHVTGTLSIYKGLYEVSSPTVSEATSIPQDKTPSAAVVYAAKGGETAEYASRLTTVTGIPSYNGTIGEAGASDLTLTFTVGEKTIQVFYKKAAQTADAEAFAAVKAAVEGSSEVTVKGFTGWYNGFQVQMNGYIPPAEDYTAEQFAQDLLDQTNNACSAYPGSDNDPSYNYSAYKTALEAIWSDLASNDKYPSLPKDQKDILADASREGTSTISRAMKRYDFLTGKYNLSNFINGRTPIVPAGMINYGELDSANNNTMIIVISIAATSALAFTMLLVFKKKKQK